PPTADMIKISPDGNQAFVNLQGKHYLVALPHVGKETVNVNITGGPSSVPVKKMSVEGGDYLAWAADGKSVSWSLGSKYYRQDITSDKSESIDLSVESPRARPKGTIVLS